MCIGGVAAGCKTGTTAFDTANHAVRILAPYRSRKRLRIASSSRVARHWSVIVVGLTASTAVPLRSGTRLRIYAVAVVLSLMRALASVPLLAKGDHSDAPVIAQDDHSEHQHHDMNEPPPAGWVWALDANVFAGYN